MPLFFLASFFNNLFSIKDLILKPNHRAVIGTGISIEIPKGYVSLVWDKSGIGSKGIKTMAGVIDNSYRGEYKIVLVNLSSKDYKIKKGDKIAQLLIQPIVHAKIKETKVLTRSSRAKKGFGSTGLK